MKAEAETAGRRYRCPQCKREVTVLLGAATVSCSRCGRSMKRVAERRD